MKHVMKIIGHILLASGLFLIFVAIFLPEGYLVIGIGFIAFFIGAGTIAFYSVTPPDKKLEE